MVVTWRHGIKVGARSPYSVEEVALAVGEMIGPAVVHKEGETLLPLSQPATKVTPSNVHHGQVPGKIVSPVRTGSKSPLLKHVGETGGGSGEVGETGGRNEQGKLGFRKVG